jgi:hypothetical protein
VRRRHGVAAHVGSKRVIHTRPQVVTSCVGLIAEDDLDPRFEAEIL